MENKIHKTRLHSLQTMFLPIGTMLAHKIENNIMKKIYLILISIVFAVGAYATGEPSTKFNIYLPPNNDPVHRDVALIVTAIYDSTHFSIIDDGMDGDSDDTKSGILMAGQSYVLYIKDNGINDDAQYASGGTLKQDGDFFHITSDKLIYASQSTNSDWQHDWVPSIDKSSLGEKFIIYSSVGSSSKRDFNVFAYSDSTYITIKKISKSATTKTGYTDVDLYNGKIVVQQMLNRGEDLIYKYSGGRDAMEYGETYVIECSKPSTVQYGSLYTNERDGGGYVPSSNGSSAGELLYFAVPFQAGTSGEQEIRIISWNDSNSVKLERYNNGSWVAMKSWTVDKLKAADWVGRNNGNVNYATTFRITCTPGKKVSVFEGNWFETGSPGTSDMATMLSSDNGTSSGTRFLSYMAPPGDEQRVRDPFTGKAFNQRLTHVYLFADRDTAHINVTDAYSGGAKLKRNYTIAPNRYVDCYLTETEWQNIYNGTGTTSGPERPYLLIQSDKNISVMNANFNDNWMMYFGSSQTSSFKMSSTSSVNYTKPGDTISITSKIVLKTKGKVEDVDIEAHAESGLKVISSTFNDVGNKKSIKGEISEQDEKTLVKFKGVPDLDPKGEYNIKHTCITQISLNDGPVVPNNCVLNVETIISGKSDSIRQQSISTGSICLNSANTSSMLFSAFSSKTFDKDSTDSWTCSCVDVNNDGYDDIFFTDKTQTNTNLLFINNKAGDFNKSIKGSLLNDKSPTVSNTWGDVDNDGDIDLLTVNDTYKPNFLHMNDGKGSFTSSPDAGEFSNLVSYYHSASFIDYDRDGLIDIFISNYMPTRFNELFHNEGKGQFKKVEDGVITSVRSESVGNTWADYDNDGNPDLLVLDNRNGKNRLFHNNGNGSFSIDSNSIIAKDGGYSVGSCWGDIDNDGDLDLFIANASNQNNYLYYNDGKGNFKKETQSIVVNDHGESHGCSFVDIDNDGDLDLYVTNDRGFKFLYMNDGTGKFTKKTNELVTADYGLAFGQSWCDFDHDGDLDLFVATHGKQANKLFINNAKNTQWIAIKLIGTQSNKSAIGARIYIKTGKLWQMSEVNSQSGFGGQSSFRQHFGLGTATVIDTVKIWWPSGLTDYYTNIKANQFISFTESNSQRVSGIVYNDANGNCAKDSDETVIPYAKVKVNSTEVYANNNGVFSTQLTSGKYALNVANDNFVSQTSCSVTYISVGNSNITNIELPASIKSKQPELSVDMGLTVLRKGFKNKMKISVTNKGYVSSSDYTLNLNLDDHIVLTKASTKWVNTGTTTINGVACNSYKWDLPALAPGEEVELEMTDSVKTSAKIGASVCLMADISDLKDDYDTSNNHVTINDKIVGAVDPNDKYVSPEGDINEDQELTYKIVFQNVGNYEASFVEVTDELNPLLDISTLQLLASSHPVKVNVSGRTIKWKFDDVNLPDSTTDKNGSTGFVIFKIKPVKNAGNGSQITNEASIVFDYSDPIKTAMTRNMVKVELITAENRLQLFPVPAQTYVDVKLNIKPKERGMKILMLYSFTGNLVKRLPMNGLAQYRLNLMNLDKGVYFLHVILEDGTTNIKQLVID